MRSLLVVFFLPFPELACKLFPTPELLSSANLREVVLPDMMIVCCAFTGSAKSKVTIGQSWRIRPIRLDRSWRNTSWGRYTNCG